MEFYPGYARYLNTVLDIEEYELWLLEPPQESYSWKQMCKIDFGSKRILYVAPQCLLVWKHYSEIMFEEINFENEHVVNQSQIENDDSSRLYFDMRSFLKKRKVKYKCVTGLKVYRTRPTDVWEIKLRKYYGLFCENGYALEEGCWLDGWIYGFTVCYGRGKENLVINGVEISRIRLIIARQKLLTAETIELLKKSFVGNHCLSWKQLGNYLEELGLGEYKQYIAFEHTLTDKELEKATEEELIAGIPLHTYYGNANDAIQIDWDE